LRELLDTTRERLDAEILLITEVDRQTQYFLARSGAPLPDRFRFSVPISHSICQHTIGMRFPLIIENTNSHPLLIGSPAITELNIGAYLGVPFGADHPALCMCAINTKPRQWTSDHRYALSDAIKEVVMVYEAELHEGADLARQASR
jgi:GAF domain-containing protein